MTFLAKVLDVASAAKGRMDAWRTARRWRTLQNRGMRIGDSVLLPASTWIDTSHCFLIEIGDNCGFGEECLILAHDAQMDEFLDIGRVGRVVIHESCHVGARCIILPGVEIGPRTLVGAGSVVTRSLPPNTVCAGNPARVICSLDDYLSKHRTRLMTSPSFQYSRSFSPDERAIVAQALATTDGYITGGHSAELRGEGATPRTPIARSKASPGKLESAQPSR